MIAINGLPEYIKNDEIKNIIEEHINRVLRECIVFIGALTGRKNPKGFWKKSEQKKVRKALCSSRVKTDEERRDIILSLLQKIYANEMTKLDIEEKFVLFKACYEAINKEEDFIQMLIKEDDMKLENWMWGRYRIEDIDARQKIRDYVSRKIGAENYPMELLGNKTAFERERILDVIGQSNMLVFEYPTVINLVFEKEEYELLANLQETEGD